jgi:hypothetical protein
MEEGVIQVEIGTQYLLELSSLSLVDGQRAGSKAANEAEMLKAGFPVPDGIVLTTEAFERFLTHNHLARQSTPQTVASAAIPADVGEALHSALTALGDGPLAVRSSGIAEDLPQASFAGQYKTVLNMRGLEALEAAVLRCWASAFNERIVAYRDAHGQLASGMALLIQHHAYRRHPLWESAQPGFHAVGQIHQPDRRRAGGYLALRAVACWRIGVDGHHNYWRANPMRRDTSESIL